MKWIMKLKKKNFHHHRRKVLLSKRFLLVNETLLATCIMYTNVYKVIPLHITLPKTSAYVNVMMGKINGFIF